MSSNDFILQVLALGTVEQALTQDSQPERGLQALAAALSARIGYRLFTVLVLDRQAGVSRRYFSSQPEAYPTGGAKPLREDSDFYARVILGGQPRICRDRNDCQQAFRDHDLIFSLGCESAVNVPVRWNGQTIASLNLLHESGWYQRDMLTELSLYAALAIPLIQKINHTT